jgi:hypothetical protein
MLTKRKRDTERDERKRAFSSFRSFITSKRDTQRERARARRKQNKKATSSSSGLSPTENKHNASPKKKERFSSAGATYLLNLPHLDVLLLVVAHGRHLVLFSLFSSLFVLRVRARETKRKRGGFVVFFE